MPVCWAKLLSAVASEPAGTERLCWVRTALWLSAASTRGLAASKASAMQTAAPQLLVNR